MFCKLALRNVRRSLKDYAIYFFTLTLGVCLFYLFNSVDSQAAMMKLTQSQTDYMQTLVEALSYLSVFISVILGFLIVYANGFLIRRRKKELGLYLTLGMEKGRLSRLLILETFLIGLFALITGLVAGIFLSQGFSVVTAKMFRADLNDFRFIFSPAAVEKTLLYFGVIFLVVMVFNTVSVSRLKLIDLLTAGRKNQEFRARKLWVSVVCFVLSIAFLGTAYRLIDLNSFTGPEWELRASLILGSAGTVLFFFSLSGFLLRAVKSSRKIYYRGLNMFTLRQFNSKINTTFVSLSVICLMLLVTIGTLSTGMSLASALSESVESSTPYDLSLVRYLGRDGEPADLKAALAADGFDLSALGGSAAQVDLRLAGDITIEDLGLREELAARYGTGSTLEALLSEQVTVISQSDYNAAAALLGLEPLDLGTDGFVLLDNSNYYGDGLNQFLAGGGTLTIGGRTLRAAETATLSVGLETAGGGGSSGIAVIPDDLASTCTIARQILDVEFQDESAAEEFQAAAEAYYGTGGTSLHSRPYDRLTTRQSVEERTAGLSTVVSYLILYIALVFLITSAAILAIQQLSESSDNAERYGLLRKLGADERMADRALFTQIGLYFALPLALAAVHSAVGIRVVNRVVEEVGHTDISRSTLLAALIFAAIYGGYFLATYLGSRAMLRRPAEGTE